MESFGKCTKVLRDREGGVVRVDILEQAISEVTGWEQIGVEEVLREVELRLGVAPGRLGTAAFAAHVEDYLRQTRMAASAAASATTACGASALVTGVSAGSCEILPKKGKFSKHESDLIHSFVVAYCEANDVEPSEILPMLREEEVAAKTTYRRAESMWAELSAMLPGRDKRSIRNHAARVLQKSKRPGGAAKQWSEEERVSLRALVAAKGKRWALIGRLLGRHRDEVKSMHERGEMKRVNSGHFSATEDSELLAAVAIATGCNKASLFVPVSATTSFELVEGVDSYPIVHPRISWTVVAERLGRKRSELDYLRRWPHVLHDWASGRILLDPAVTADITLLGRTKDPCPKVVSRPLSDYAPSYNLAAPLADTQSSASCQAVTSPDSLNRSSHIDDLPQSSKTVVETSSSKRRVKRKSKVRDGLVLVAALEALGAKDESDVVWAALDRQLRSSYYGRSRSDWIALSASCRSEESATGCSESNSDFNSSVSASAVGTRKVSVSFPEKLAIVKTLLEEGGQKKKRRTWNKQCRGQLGFPLQSREEESDDDADDDENSASDNDWGHEIGSSE